VSHWHIDKIGHLQVIRTFLTLARQVFLPLEPLDQSSFVTVFFKIGSLTLVLMAHVCNPSYSEGRDQEGFGSKPAQKDQSQKRAGGVVQGVGPEFKPQYYKEKKKIGSLQLFAQSRLQTMILLRS
jgi:hypothetical protein